MQLHEDRLYTEVEVAEYLQVAPVTLRKWRGEGRIGYTALGANIRYTRDQVMEFIQRSTQAPVCSNCGGEAHAPA